MDASRSSERGPATTGRQETRASRNAFQRRILGMTNRSGPQRMERDGRLVGVLFIAGSVAALPGAALLTDGIDRDALMITALGVLSGALCFTVVPWARLGVGSLYLVIAIGTGEVALAAEVVDEIYRVLYFIVVAYAALVLPNRVGVAAVVGLVLLLLAEPAINSNDTREQLGILTLYAPTLVIVAGTIRYLQETLERREERTRAYAREAVELTIRLRGADSASSTAEDLAELRRALKTLS